MYFVKDQNLMRNKIHQKYKNSRKEDGDKLDNQQLQQLTPQTTKKVKRRRIRR